MPVHPKIKKQYADPYKEEQAAYPPKKKKKLTIQKAKYYIFDPAFTRFDSPWVYIYIYTTI